jgi:hypothetical protein
MKIEFRKITKDGSSFELKNDELLFSGSFKRVSNSIVKIDYKLKGKLLHSCDGCAEDFKLSICEESSLYISDGRYSGDSIDVIETFDGFINFDEIFQSEVETIKSDYHYCEKCIENFKE